MSWLFSQALVAAYSAGTCSDGEQSAPSSGTHTQQAFLSHGKMTAFSRLSRFGMTFKPLTDSRGEDLLTWYREGFLARTYPQQERAQESPESGAECGGIWRELLGRYDRDTHTLKTAQCSLFEDLMSSSPTLPRWGLMRNGELFRQQTLVPPIVETESGLWPTPTRNDAVGAGYQRANGNHYFTLVGAVGATKHLPPEMEEKRIRMWPTPRAANPGSRPNGKGGKILAEEVAIMEGLRERGTKMWPTPTSTLGTNGGLVTPSKGREGGTLIEALSARTLWPTPAARDCKGANNREHCETNGTGRKHMDQLANAVAHPDLRFATPQTRDFRTGSTERWDNPERSRNLNDQIGGQLNPTWVEWLMGWPLGWTDLKPLETGKWRQWLRQHGAC